MTFHQDVDDRRVLRQLADPIVTRMYGHSVATNLANLKEMLEA